ncbi:MAG: hypothetical protein HKN87_01630 [Saprospiraceae bacterium]|nr:hypothetical protein [Saprospiraceae bacterium]
MVKYLIFVLALFISTWASTQDIMWEATLGPPGASVHTLIVDESIGKVFASFIVPKGIYHSSLANPEWEKTGFDEDKRISALAIDSTGILYAGSWGEVFRSADGGDSWTKSIVSTNGQYVEALVADKTGAIFAGLSLKQGAFDGGIFRSMDHGTTWRHINMDLDVATLAIDHSQTLYVGSANAKGLFFSKDQGDQWWPVGSNWDADVSAICFNDSNHIFAGVYDRGIFRSNDGGNTWKNLLPNQGLGRYFFNMFFDNENVLYVTINNRGLNKSMDQGETWQLINPVQTGAYLDGLAITSGNQLFIGSFGRGILTSVNGGEIWSSFNEGLYFSRIKSMAFNQDNTLFAGTSGSLFRSFDQGTSWEQTGLKEHVSSLLFHKDSLIFAGTRNGLFLSDNQGETWNNRAFEEEHIDGIFATKKGDLFIVAESRLWKSENSGNQWSNIGKDLELRVVRAAAVNSKDQMFLGDYFNGVYRSVDDGLTWRSINVGLNSLHVQSLAIDSKDRLYLGILGEGLYTSVNNGDSWEGTAFMDPLKANFGSIVTNDQDHIFIGVDIVNDPSTVYRSTDHGERWEDVGMGFPQTDFDVSVGPLILDKNSILFTGTSGYGIFRSISATTSSPEESRQAFHVGKNYPNPYIHQTVIPLDLDERIWVRIDIISLDGKVVATITDGMVNAGYHKIAVDSHLNPGLYWYRVQVGGQMARGKMLKIW